jgi:pimeloyl-ACP methyl ester carboxylesterase
MWSLVTALIIAITSFDVSHSYVVVSTQSHPTSVTAPFPIPAYSSTGLKNEIYTWRQQTIRYVASGPANAKHSVLLLHGLFLNADHWRHTLKDLGDAGYRVYAIDLLGSGYSSKPDATSVEAKWLNGENGRFTPFNEVVDPELDMLLMQRPISIKKKQPPTRENVVLGTNTGGRRVVPKLELSSSTCYNYYTWAEQVNDFTRDVIFNGVDHYPNERPKTTSLIANSKGTIVALQAMLDKPEYYNGVCEINPTYREMHRAELPKLATPVVKAIQRFLKMKGHGLYRAATKPQCIKHFLKEPYSNKDAIDDELVSSMMEPLHLPHADDVVFDELSYSTGPLFEELLQDVNDNSDVSRRKPIWVCYGKEDPWLCPKRVESLATKPFKEDGPLVVDKVIAIENAGHCPHDERPEELQPILMEFLRACHNSEQPRYDVAPIELHNLSIHF